MPGFVRALQDSRQSHIVDQFFRDWRTRRLERSDVTSWGALLGGYFSYWYFYKYSNFERILKHS